MSKHDPYINKLIFSKYLIRKKIGKGSFGTVYQGINTSNNEKIAIKIEKREKNDSGTLENEALRLVYLQGEGIPCVYCYGNNLTHNLLVEELLGKSLDEIFNSYGKPFSLKTVCVLGIEMIKRIQYIHSKYYIHRDIKPDNFMTGRGPNEKKIYIIDFGLAKKYYSVSKAQHIKFVTGKHLVGTARYCGRNAHRGYEQGRRDDLESIGYLLMYFLLGVLPWQGLKIKKYEDHFEKIAEKKYSTSFEELTQGQPEEFLSYFKYVDKLAFEDQPNYLYIIGLFQSVIDKYCQDCLYDFDWKKDTCTYISRGTNNLNQQIDVSLIVNRNDASGMDYSNMNEEEEKDDKENEENDVKNKTKKRIKKKEVFMGEDVNPIEEEEKRNNKNKKKENKHENHDNKIRRSKTMMNIRHRKKESDENNLKKKKNKKEKNRHNGEDNSDYDGNNREKGKINSEINEEKKNQELNMEENTDIPNNIINDEKQNLLKNEGKNNVNEIPNENNENDDLNDNYQNNNYKNSINKNKYNDFKYDDNNILNEEKNNDNNDSDTKDKINEEQNNNEELLNQMSFDQEEGSKKRKRNRTGSYDSKKDKEENIICKCSIF